MKYRLENKKVLVVLEKGEEIFESLYEIIKKLDIKFGWINGIGAASNIILGAYPSSTKEYIKKKFKGEFELASIMGNITTKEDNPFIHIHATISDEECNAFAGHLFTATVSVTCEIILNISNKSIVRKECNEVGLYLWDFNHNEK
tara:strand:+ start:35019 stop:35453 length:435 start_codon:yes stop_codon:yes gene_type:complete